ncbi:MAG: 16S rRNA (adenine(1518)-N(6)/adenine(1519)-N(6))-dimethyltransferase, partial [Proteobacteria bacterium]|nr:16S rRNA (adenine(1518)-N(6)/adenine(1519)-N(6))-dimethyltransferase [Pseudomonadota bacterium]
MSPSPVPDAVAALPPLRAVIARHGLAARKGLGQHFLLDLNLTGRIARAAGDIGEGTVIEVGPGPGGLTRALLMEGAAKVIAVERDKRCIEALADLVEAADGRFQIVEGDALEIDTASLGKTPRRIVANLPYNVSVPLLVDWLEKAGQIASMTLM